MHPAFSRSARQWVQFLSIRSTFASHGYVPQVKAQQKPILKKKKTKKSPPKPPVPRPKDFLDMIAPTAIRFNTDHYILGGTYRCALALRGYPTSTEELALLRHLGEKSGVTLHIYARKVTPSEEKVIIDNASNKNRMPVIFLFLTVSSLITIV